MHARCSRRPRAGRMLATMGINAATGAKVHVAVDTLGHLLATVVTPASEQERAQVADLAEQVQTVTGESGRVGLCGSRLYRYGASRGGRRARDPVGGGQAARCPGTAARLRVVAKTLGGRAQSLLGWPGSGRFARDYERLPQTVAGLTFLAFTCLMLSQLIHLALQCITGSSRPYAHSECSGVQPT